MGEGGRGVRGGEGRGEGGEARRRVVDGDMGVAGGGAAG